MKPVYILGTSGHISNPEGRSISELLEIAGANTGNLMFQYAVGRMIGGEKRFIGKANLPYNEAGGCGDGSYLVFPAANHLRTGADWSGLCGFFENSKVPLVIIGLGAQADSTADPRKTAEALRNDASAMRLINVLRNKAAWISVRGAFTAEVCELLEIPNVEILGCPSLLLNPHPDAGKRMAGKLTQAARSPNPSIALSAAGPFDIRNSPKADLEKRLFSHTRKANGLYVQQSGGEAAIAIASRRFESLTLSALLSIRGILEPDLGLEVFIDYFRNRGRFFISAEEWINSMAPLDFCLGTRLHGNMAAIAGGTPGCVISHDSRTDELAEEMMLPRLTGKDLLEARDLRDLISKVKFDPVGFDRSRLAKVSKYVSSLGKLGLTYQLPVL